MYQNIISYCMYRLLLHVSFIIACIVYYCLYHLLHVSFIACIIYYLYLCMYHIKTN